MQKDTFDIMLCPSSTSHSTVVAHNWLVYCCLAPFVTSPPAPPTSHSHLGSRVEISTRWRKGKVFSFVVSYCFIHLLFFPRLFISNCFFYQE